MRPNPSKCHICRRKGFLSAILRHKCAETTYETSARTEDSFSYHHCQAVGADCRLAS